MATTNNKFAVKNGLLTQNIDFLSPDGSNTIAVTMSNSDVLNVDGTLTATLIGGNGSSLTSLNASNISTGTLAQARLANSSFTINGTSISLGGTSTITSNTTQSHSNGSYITGGSFNGGTAVTWAVDATTASTASKVVARDANANIYANNAIFTAVSGNGAGLSSLAGANVTGTVANATYATSAGSATTAATVTTAAQPNITSVGTLTSLAVTGNATADTFQSTNNGNGTNFKVGDDAWIGDINTADTIRITGQQNAANAYIVFGNSNNNSLGRAGTGPLTYTGAMAATANVTAPQLISNVATGTAPLVVTSTTQVANLNAATAGLATYATTANSVAGANVSGTVANATYATSAGSATTATSATTAGTVTTAAQPNITSVGTLTSLGVNGAITSTTYTSNIATGTAPLTVTSTTRVSNLNVAQAGVADTSTIALASTGNYYPTFVTGTSGNLAEYANANFVANLANGALSATTFVGAFSGNGAALSSIAGANVTGTVANATYATSAGSATTATSATTAGTVTTAAQPNITSVGTLTSLGVNGTITSTTYTSNVATGTAPLTVTSTTRVSNLNVAYANVADFINVTTGSAGNVYPIFGNALTGNVTEYANANFVANLSNGYFTATGFVGNGAALSSLTGANVTGTVANATYAVSAGSATTATSATSATTAGTVTTAAQPNITSVTSSGGTFTIGNNGNGGTYFDRQNIVLNSYSGATEGGQLTLAWPGASGLTGQGNSSWSIDVDGSNNYRVFYQNATGSTGVAILAYSANADVNFGANATVTSKLTAANLTANSELTVGGNAVITGNLTVNGTTIYSNVSTMNIKDPIIELGGTGNASNLTSNDGKDRGELYHVFDTGANAQVDKFIGWDVSNAEFAFGSNVTVANEVVTFNTLGNIRASTFIGSLSGAATTAGTVTTAAQPNITSVGTLTSLGVNGTVTAVNITANTGVFTGNGAALTTLNASNITSGTLAQARLANSSLTVNGTAISLGGSGTITANTTQTLTLGSYLTGSSFNGGTAVTAAVDATTTSTASKVVARDANANIYANNAIFTAVSGNGAGLSSLAGGNVTGTVANATYATSAGSATTATSATTAGTVTTAAQPNITSVGTLTSLGVNGAITSTTYTSNVATGTAPLTVTSTTQVANLYVARAGIGDASTISLATTGNYYPTFVNATSGNLAEYANANFVANVANGALTATTFVGAHSGNGAALSSLTGANVTGTVANATYAVSAGSASSASTAAAVSLHASNEINIGGSYAGNSRLYVNYNDGGAITEYGFYNGGSSLANIVATQYIGSGAGLTSIPGGNVTGTVANATYATSAGSAGTAGTVTNAAQPNITSHGTLTSLDVSGVSTLPKININRSSTATTGISWYSSGYSAWTDYMSPAAATGAGPFGNITAPSGTLVTSWALRRFIENSAGYGWTFESGTSQQVTPTVVAEIRASDGAARFGSVQTSGTITTTNSTAATSTTTGAVVVTGGIGVSGNSYMSNMTVKSNVAYVSPNGANTITNQMVNGGTLAWTGTSGQLFSITDSMTGTIFSVNDTSGIPSIEVLDTGLVKIAEYSGFISYGVSNALTANGNSQSTALVLTRPINNVTTTAASTGVRLPAAYAGMRVLVRNGGANALSIYPATGAVINSLATNAAYTLGVGAMLEFVAMTSSQWYSLNATYA